MKKYFLVLNASIFLLFVNNYSVYADNIKKTKLNLSQEINVKDIITDKNIKLSDYKGKFVFLDFWATWCSPCVESIPHYNQLQTKYPNKIKIIGISSESKAILKDFYKKNKINFTMTTDINKETEKKYPHYSIPFTVIIKPNGELLGDFHPTQLDNKLVENIISGRYISVNKDIKNTPTPATENNTNNIEKSISYMSFSKAKDGGKAKMRKIKREKSDGSSSNSIELENLDIKSIYRYALNDRFNNNQIVDNTELSSDKSIYTFKSQFQSFKTSSPDEQQKIDNTILNYLDLSIGIKSTIEKKLSKVKILKIFDNNRIEKSNSLNTNIDLGSDYLKASAINLKLLSNILSKIIKVSVINETNLNENVDINLSWNKKNPETILNSLEKSGFYFENSEKEMNILILDKK